MSAGACSNCHAEPAVARGLGWACYRYWLRHGIARPLELTERQYEVNRRREDRAKAATPRGHRSLADPLDGGTLTREQYYRERA